jgi:predicted nucleic acid-binding protein
MRIVVDASVAIAWVATDESEDYADQVYQLVLERGGIVPALWYLEMANVLAKKIRQRKMPATVAALAMDRLVGLRIVSDDIEGRVLAPRLLELTQHHGLSAYDAAYLELAKRRGLSLATLDDALRAAAVADGVAVVAP